MDAIRLLIAVQDTANAGIVQWALKTAQISVNIETLSEEESLFAYLCQKAVDCIVTDQHTDRGVFSVLAVLKKLNKHLPIIVLGKNPLESSQFHHEQQAQLTVQFTKSQLTPQILAQTVMGLTQIHRHMVRSELAEHSLKRERHQFQRLVQMMPVAVFELDKKGNIKDFNGQISELLPLTTEGILDKPLWESLPKNFPLEDAVYTTLSGEIYSHQFKSKAGLVLSEFSPVYDNQRKVAGITAIFIKKPDTQAQKDKLNQLKSQLDKIQTQSRKLKNKLDEKEEELKLLHHFLDNHHDVLHSTRVALFQVMVDPKGSVTVPFVSRSIIQITGYDAEQLSDVRIQQKLFKAEELAHIQSLMATAVEQWLPCDFNITVNPKTGPALALHVNAVPKSHANGIQWNGIVSSAKEVESQIDGERLAELVDERDAAMEEVRLKSLFLMNLSREMRFPLETMMNMVNMLLETKLDAEQKEFVSLLHNAGHAMITMTNDITDFSRIEADSFYLNEIDFDLRVLLDELYRQFHQRGVQAGLDVFCLLPYQIHGTIRADAGRIKQIITHLFFNAMYFTKKGDVTLQVNVLQDREKDMYLRFDVSDTGQAITPMDRRYLFQMHSPRQNAGEFRSAGIRMLVARQLAEAMGGEFGLCNNDGGGATFWFSIPVIKRAEVKRPKFNEVILTGKRVLIACHQEGGYRQLAQAMNRWGMYVEIVTSGEAVLDKMVEACESRSAFDFAILDARLAEMDHFELANIISKDNLLGSVTLILATDVGIRGDSERARKAGLQALLTKPVDETLLANCFRTLLAMPEVLRLTTMVTKHSIADSQQPDKPLIMVGCEHLEKRKKLQAALYQAGFRVDLADSGPDVIQAMQMQQYAAVVLSTSLPLLDGFETAKTIKRQWPDMVVIGVCEQLDEKTRFAAEAVGMRDCLNEQNFKKFKKLLAAAGREAIVPLSQ